MQIEFVILLLQEENVSLHLQSFLLVELLLHLTQGLLLRLLSHLSFKLFSIDAILQHGNLVSVVILDRLNHSLLLPLLLDLTLLELLLLVNELVLFQLRGKLVDLLAEPDLLCVSLEHLRPLLVKHLFFELLLLYLLDFVVAFQNLLLPPLAHHPLVLLDFAVHLVFFQEGLKLLLLLLDAIISFELLAKLLHGLASGRV